MIEPNKYRNWKYQATIPMQNTSWRYMKKQAWLERKSVWNFDISQSKSEDYRIAYFSTASKWENKFDWTTWTKEERMNLKKEMLPLTFKWKFSMFSSMNHWMNVSSVCYFISSFLLWIFVQLFILLGSPALLSLSCCFRTNIHNCFLLLQWFYKRCDRGILHNAQFTINSRAAICFNLRSEIIQRVKYLFYKNYKRIEFEYNNN